MDFRASSIVEGRVGLPCKFNGRGLLSRAGQLIGIDRALDTTFTDAVQADAWVHRPNAAPMFGADELR